MRASYSYSRGCLYANTVPRLTPLYSPTPGIIHPPPFVAKTETSSLHTLVIGGGLSGLSTAIALQANGHTIELLEARDDIAQEASHANGALLTASMSDPWNAPGVHKHLAASLFNPQSAMKLRLSAIPSLLTWGIKFLANSTAERHSKATEANYQLAAYSIRQTEAFRERLGLKYDASVTGAMKLFRDKLATAAAAAHAKRLAAHQLKFEELDADGAVAREPQLRPIRDQIAGAIYYPGDEVGDAYLFCKELARKLVEGGAALRTNVRAERIMVANGRVRAVQTDKGEFRADHVVVAAGNWSPALLNTVGISLQVKPVKGYTVTIPVPAAMDQLPVMPVIDDALHAVVVPLPGRLRIAGTAEFAGFDQRMRSERIEGLLAFLEALYPHIAKQIDRNSAKPWTGLRPMSCDGKPFIGSTPVQGLYINAGHGHLGWTMAMGSACVLGDLVAGRTPAIDASPFSATR